MDAHVCVPAVCVCIVCACVCAYVSEGVSVGEEMSLSPLIDSDFLPWRNCMEGSELNLNPLNLIKPVLGKSDFNKNLKGKRKYNY